MRFKLCNSIKLLAFTSMLLAFASCSNEIDLGGDESGISTGGKVRIELFTQIPDYAPPATRMGSAQENMIDMTPWVLVFKGSGDNATYVEAAQAIGMAGKRFVTLTTQSTDCRLLILANPQAKFTTSGGTEYGFSVANFDAVLNPGNTPKTIAEACTLLLTQKLDSPQNTVPFASESATKPLIPMSYVHAVSNITDATKIGDAGNLLQLERVVAKVTVANTAANFTLEGATVINAPRQGQLHRLDATLMNNSGALTNYKAASGDVVTGIAAATTGSGGILQTTATNPIYLFESRVLENTCVIVKGVYQGVTYYYKLSFLSMNNNARMNVLRNHEYTFHITSVQRPGYTTYDDAVVAARPPSNEDITWIITVSDKYSHDIVDNGEYYLGVTNSNYTIYDDGAVNNTHAFTVTTNCTGSLTINSITVSGAGLSLASPAGGKIPLAVGTTPTPCDVKLNITAGFTTGSVKLRLGTLEKEIVIEKLPAIEGVLPHLEFSGGYLSAEIESGAWLSLSADGTNKQGNYLNSPNGSIYIMPEPNLGSTNTFRSGVVYLSHRDNSNGRIKLAITQKMAPNN